MIVDLLRNDLGKVSVPGTVHVSSLFELERFETVWQMTSTVESTLQQGMGLADLMTALFPCGSITGAPKIRTMQIIRELERFHVALTRERSDCSNRAVIAFSTSRFARLLLTLNRRGLCLELVVE
jgi:hypothetical protein